MGTGFSERLHWKSYLWKCKLCQAEENLPSPVASFSQFLHASSEGKWCPLKSSLSKEKEDVPELLYFHMIQKETRICYKFWELGSLNKCLRYLLES